MPLSPKLQCIWRSELLSNYPDSDTHLVMVQHHLELVEVEPLCGLLCAEVVEAVPGGEAEGVELPLRAEEEGGGRLLVAHARVVALPLAHDVHVPGVAGEAVRQKDNYLLARYI